MYFSHIQARNWRNFESIDLKLQQRAFLVGANASGKSNFLDVFRFLRDLASVGGGLQAAVEARGGISRIRHLNARNQTDIVIEVGLEENGQERWRYEIAFNQPNNILQLKHERVWHEGQMLLQRPDAEDDKDPRRLTQTHLEQTFANAAFRAINDFFREVHYYHLVPQLVREPERAVARSADPFGSDFLELIARTPAKTREARLRRIQQALSHAVPQLAELTWERDERGAPHLKARYANWRPLGVFQSEREFSDGTLRLIGLLWTLQEGDGPLLLEEPELSLHDSLVRMLVPLMQAIMRARKRAPRQTLISTHNPSLLSAEGIDPAEVLLFRSDSDGTRIEVGADNKIIAAELDAGLSLGQTVADYTAPQGLHQLARSWE